MNGWIAWLPVVAGEYLDRRRCSNSRRPAVPDRGARAESNLEAFIATQLNLPDDRCEHDRGNLLWDIDLQPMPGREQMQGRMFRGTQPGNRAARVGPGSAGSASRCQPVVWRGLVQPLHTFGARATVRALRQVR
jgi:hypothetical protein